jgi:hypothetical protein
MSNPTNLSLVAEATSVGVIKDDNAIPDHEVIETVK